ncbi:MAG: hypothetical protein IJC44_03685 [Clostridia bacterium]|nr:hypothetical protein [Clostridia bacterium]
MNHYEFCGTAVPLGRIDELFCDMSGDVFLRENAGVPGPYEHHVQSARLLLEYDEPNIFDLHLLEQALSAATSSERPPIAAAIQEVIYVCGSPDDLLSETTLGRTILYLEKLIKMLTDISQLEEVEGKIKTLCAYTDHLYGLFDSKKHEDAYHYYRGLSGYCSELKDEIEDRILDVEDLPPDAQKKQAIPLPPPGIRLENRPVRPPKSPSAQPPKPASAPAQPKGTSAPAPKPASAAQPKPKPKPAAPPKPSITRLWPSVGPQEKKPPELGALDDLGLLELHRKVETGAIGRSDLDEMRRKGTEGLLHHFGRAFKGSLIEKEATLLAEKLLLLGGESERQAMACFLILNNYLGTSDRPFAALHSEADHLNGRTKSLERGIFDPRRFAGRSGRLAVSIGVSLLAALLLSVLPGLLDLQVLGMSVFGMAALGLCMATGLISGGLLNCGLHFALVNLAAILGMGGDPATHVHRTVVWALLLTCLPMALRLLKAGRCSKQVEVLQGEIDLHLGEIDRALACARALEKAVTPMFEQLKGHPAANADFVRDAQPGLARIRKEYKDLAADLGALRSKTDKLRKGE